MNHQFISAALIVTCLVFPLRNTTGCYLAPPGITENNLTGSSSDRSRSVARTPLDMTAGQYRMALTVLRNTAEPLMLDPFDEPAQEVLLRTRWFYDKAVSRSIEIPFDVPLYLLLLPIKIVTMKKHCLV